MGRFADLIFRLSVRFWNAEATRSTGRIFPGLWTMVPLLALSAAGCSDQQVQVLGAGASSPAVLYRQWAKDFERSHPDKKIVYDSLGSDRGVEFFFQNVVDFGRQISADK